MLFIPLKNFQKSIKKQINLLGKDAVFKDKKNTYMQLIFYSIFFGSIVWGLFDNEHYVLAGLALMALVFLFIGFLVDKGDNYIKLSSEGISFNGLVYQWENMKNTYLLFRPVARQTDVYLVILLNDGDIKKHLLIFDGSDAKLAAYIEYFKEIGLKNIT